MKHLSTSSISGFFNLWCGIVSLFVLKKEQKNTGVYKRLACDEKNRVQERNQNAALNLACEYYGDDNLIKKGPEVQKTCWFWRYCKTPQCKYHVVWTNKGKNTGSIWWLVYSKIQHKNDLPTINMELLGGHCFYSKKMDVLCNQWECKGWR